MWQNLIILMELFSILMIIVCTSLMQAITVLELSMMMVLWISFHLLIVYFNISNSEVCTFVGRGGGFQNSHGSNAQFNYPQQLIHYERENCFLVADCDNHLIRKITMKGDNWLIMKKRNSHNLIQEVFQHLQEVEENPLKMELESMLPSPIQLESQWINSLVIFMYLRHLGMSSERFHPKVLFNVIHTLVLINFNNIKDK